MRHPPFLAALLLLLGGCTPTLNPGGRLGDDDDDVSSDDDDDDDTSPGDDDDDTWGDDDDTWGDDDDDIGWCSDFGEGTVEIWSDFESGEGIWLEGLLEADGEALSVTTEGGETVTLFVTPSWLISGMNGRGRVYWQGWQAWWGGEGVLLAELDEGWARVAIGRNAVPTVPLEFNDGSVLELWTEPDYCAEWMQDDVMGCGVVAPLPLFLSWTGAFTAMQDYVLPGQTTWLDDHAFSLWSSRYYWEMTCDDVPAVDYSWYLELQTPIGVRGSSEPAAPDPSK